MSQSKTIATGWKFFLILFPYHIFCCSYFPPLLPNHSWPRWSVLKWKITTCFLLFKHFLFFQSLSKVNFYSWEKMLELYKFLYFALLYFGFSLFGSFILIQTIFSCLSEYWKEMEAYFVYSQINHKIVNEQNCFSSNV